MLADPTSNMVFEVLRTHVEARNFSVVVGETIYAQAIRYASVCVCGCTYR